MLVSATAAAAPPPLSSRIFNDMVDLDEIVCKHCESSKKANWKKGFMWILMHRFDDSLQQI